MTSDTSHGRFRDSPPAALEATAALLEFVDSSGAGTEQRLKQIIDSLPIALALFDEHERLTAWNGAYVDVNGPIVAPMIRPGMTLCEILKLHLEHEQVPEAIGCELQWLATRMTAFRHGDAVNVMSRPSGAWHQIHNRRLSDGSTVVMCTDITELKRKEQELELAQRRLRDYADSASDWFWETDADHRFTYVSSRLNEITGLEVDDFIGRRRGDFASDDERELWQRHRADLDARRPFRDFRYQVRASNDRTVHCSVSGRPIIDDDGTFHGYRGTAMDVTAQVEARAANNRFLDAIESVSDGYVLWDADDRLVVANSTWISFIQDRTTVPLEPGLHYEELIRDNVANGGFPGALADPEAWIAERLRRHRSGGAPFEIERSDGRWYLMRERRTPEGGILQTASDITDLKRRERALQESEERFRGFAESAADWFWELDADLRFTFVSSRYEQITGIDTQELIGKRFEHLATSSAQAEPAMLNAVKAMARGEPIQNLEMHGVADSASLMVHSLSGQVIRDESGRITGYRGTGRDVTQARLLSMQLAYQASHDPLTGLVNRRGFEQRVARSLGSAQAGRGQYALCMIDLDRFKIVNDTCGHAAGDQLLRELSELIKGKVRGRDTLARLGGDEFALLLDNCSPDEARRIAEALRSTIEGFRFDWNDQSFTLSASLGLVLLRPDMTMSALLRAADSACYLAKEQGRNRVHLYARDDDELARREDEMKWVARLNSALSHDRFVLHAQCIRSTQPSGTRPENHHEVLVRMRGESDELIETGAFLPAAERYGIATRIDRWVVQTVFEKLRRRPQDSAGVSMLSINLSGQSLSDRDFRDEILHQLKNSPRLGRSLCFEVTETAAIADLAAAERFMQLTRQYGCRFALDDFGTGLSSFAYLRDLPVDFVKIDGAFIQDIEHDPAQLAMVRSINQVAHVLGKQTIAEYVTSEASVRILADVGVNYVQGFGVGRPHPIEQVLG